MKKIISALCILTLLFCLSACGKKNKTPEETVKNLFTALQKYDEKEILKCFSSGSDATGSILPKEESAMKYGGIYKAMLSKLSCSIEKTDYSDDESAAAVTVKVTYYDGSDAMLAALIDTKMNLGSSKKEFNELLNECFPEKLTESESVIEKEMIIPCVKTDDDTWIIGGISEETATQFSEFFLCGISEGIDRFNELSEIGDK